MKTSTKTAVSLLIIVLTIAATIMCFTACSGEKKIDFSNGEWSASSVKVGKTEIESLKISVRDEVENASDKSVINVGNKKYRLVFYVNGEEIVPESLTYYSKELKTSFAWEEKEYLFFAILKENKKTGEIYAEAQIGELEEKDGMASAKEWTSIILK